MSAVAASWRTSSLPSGSRRLTPIARLLRCPAANPCDIRVRMAPRDPSGKAEFSILMTSAPKSPKRRPVSPPTTITPRSSTRMPSRGRPWPARSRPARSSACRTRWPLLSAVGAAAGALARWPSTSTTPAGTAAVSPGAISVSRMKPRALICAVASAWSSVSTAAVGTPCSWPCSSSSAAGLSLKNSEIAWSSAGELKRAMMPSYLGSANSGGRPIQSNMPCHCLLDRTQMRT